MIRRFLLISSALLLALAFTACQKNGGKPSVRMVYAVNVSEDVLKVANVEVHYVDKTGDKKKEIVTKTPWKLTIVADALPLTEGVWAKITPKVGVPESTYSLDLETIAAYGGHLGNGKKIADIYSNTPKAPTVAKTAAEIQAWCATSPTVSFTVSQEGFAKQTHVDFGGNGFWDDIWEAICLDYCYTYDEDPDEWCYE